MKKKCEMCGKEFVAHHSRCKYCPDGPCREKARQESLERVKAKRQKEQRIKNSKPRVCRWCEYEFVNTESASWYCSDVCHELATSEHSRKHYAIKTGRKYDPLPLETRRAVRSSRALGAASGVSGCPWKEGKIQGHAANCDPVLGF